MKQFPISSLSEIFCLKSKDKVLEMIKFIKMTFKERLEKNNWMTDRTKEKALIPTNYKKTKVLKVLLQNSTNTFFIYKGENCGLEYELLQLFAKDQGYEIKVGKFPFSASGKASAAGAKDGFVKLIFDAKYGELLGAHMIGANVTEMIAEIVAVRKLETTGMDLIKTVHPHPTMSEAIMEAAAAAYGEVIHL